MSTSTNTSDAHDATPPARPRALSVAIPSIAFLMVTLDALVVVTALPSIHTDLGGDPASLQWVVNAYNLTFAAGIITAAALGDRYGRLRVFLLGLLLFTTTSVACALAPDLGALVAFRAIQGAGAAIVTPVGLTLATSAFPPERRGAVVGIWGGIAGLGVAAGPLVGGAVTEGLDWHWIFWANVPIGLLAVWGTRRVLSESFGPHARLDVPGMLLAGTGFAVLVWALMQAPDTGLTSTRTMTGLFIGGIVTAAFFVREARTTAPMIPLRLFRSRAFAAAAVANLLTFGSIFSAAYLTSQFFQLGLGQGPLATGLQILPWTATPLVVAPIAGRMYDRVGVKPLAVPGLVAQAAAFCWILYLAGSGASWIAYVAPFVIAGVGVSLALPTLPAATLDAVPPDELGKAVGVVSTLQRFGTVVAIAVVTAVFDANGSLTNPGATTAGYQPALAVAAAFSALAALTVLGCAGRTRQPA